MSFIAVADIFGKKAGKPLGLQALYSYCIGLNIHLKLKCA